MSDTATQNQQHQIEDLSNRVKKLEKVVGKLMKKIDQKNYACEEGEPEYGTKEWWAWAIQEGEKDMKAGRGITLNSKEEIDAYFDNL